MRLTFLTVLMIGAIASQALDVLAFDGGREGFVIGGGPGLSMILSTEEQANTERKYSISTDCYVGYAVDDRFAAVWWNKLFWLIHGTRKVEYGSDLVTENSPTLTLLGMTGPGMILYMKPNARSLYLTCSAGLSFRERLFEDDYDAFLGPGVAAGVGWEDSRHFNLDLSITYSRLSRPDGNDTEHMDLVTVRLGIVASGY
jgi:hypothetical protein